MTARRLSTTLALLVVVALAGCDDKPKPADQKSVLEGGKAESAEGKKLENAKREIEGAEKQLEDRSERMYESAQDEKVERGVP
jgi:uncharacterized lipoprotein